MIPAAKKVTDKRRVIGIAAMIVSNDPSDYLVTYGLGSCLGITLYDPMAKVGGLLHIMLPVSKLQVEDAKLRPLRYVETGVPMLFKACYALGAEKSRIVVRVAGGASVQMTDGDSVLQIGKRNTIALKRMLMKNRVLISAIDVGGAKSRTLSMQIGTGRVDIVAQGEQYELKKSASRVAGGM